MPWLHAFRIAQPELAREPSELSPKILKGLPKRKAFQSLHVLYARWALLLKAAFRCACCGSSRRSYLAAPIDFNCVCKSGFGGPLIAKEDGRLVLPFAVGFGGFSPVGFSIVFFSGV